MKEATSLEKHPWSILSVCTTFSQYRCVGQMHLISWDTWMQMWLTSLMRHCPGRLWGATGQGPLSQQGKAQVSLEVRGDQMHRRKFSNFLGLTDSLISASLNRDDSRNRERGGFQTLLFISSSTYSSSSPYPSSSSNWTYFLENDIWTSTQNVISVTSHKLSTPKQHTQIRQ